MLTIIAQKILTHELLFEVYDLILTQSKHLRFYWSDQ